MDRRVMSVQDLYDDEGGPARSPAELFRGPAAQQPPSERGMMREWAPEAPLPSAAPAQRPRVAQPVEQREAPPQAKMGFDDGPLMPADPLDRRRVQPQATPVDLSAWSSLQQHLTEYDAESIERYFVAGMTAGNRTPLWIVVSACRALALALGDIQRWQHNITEGLGSILAEEKKEREATVAGLRHLNDGLVQIAQRFETVLSWQREQVVPVIGALIYGYLGKSRTGWVEGVESGPMAEMLAYVESQHAAPAQEEQQEAAPEVATQEPPADAAPAQEQPQESLLSEEDLGRLFGGRDKVGFARWLKSPMAAGFPAPVRKRPKMWSRREVLDWFAGQGLGSAKEE